MTDKQKKILSNTIINLYYTVYRVVQLPKRKLQETIEHVKKLVCETKHRL